MLRLGLAQAETLPVDSSAPHLPPLVVASANTPISTAGPQPVRIAWPRAGLPIAVTQRGVDGDLTVAIRGGIELTGHAARDTLDVLVCQPGPVGDHFYAGQGNHLALRSDVIDGKLKVEGRVHLIEKILPPSSAQREQLQELPFRAELDEARLCTAPPRKSWATSEDPEQGGIFGEVSEEHFPAKTAFVNVNRGVAVSFLDRPGGVVLHSRMSDRYGYSLARISHEGKWDQVATGDGPYLLGWVPSRKVRKQSANDKLGLLGTLNTNNLAPLDLYTDVLRKQPLHELPSGTELKQFGQVVARLTRAGYARMSVTRDGYRYAVAAVDGDVVVEGWIELSQLGALVKEGPSPLDGSK